MSYINDNYIAQELNELLDDNRFIDELNERLWMDDSVTGNASGSYTFNAFEAEENLCHNTDLLQEAMNEFGYTPNDYKGAEWADVLIRCYLLGGIISEIINDFEQ